jgi:hypothetical protein
MITMTPVAPPPYEEGRWYLGEFRQEKIGLLGLKAHQHAYFAARFNGRDWEDGCGCELIDDGWELVAISEELPELVQP